MMKIIAQLILIFTFGNLGAQSARFPFQTVDRFCRCPEFEYRGFGFQLRSIDKSSAPMEIRLITALSPYQTNISVIRYDSGLFTSSYYVQKIPSSAIQLTTPPDSVKGIVNWDPYPFKKFVTTKKGLDSTFFELLNHRLLTLPDQGTLTNEGYMTSYTIEYIMNGKSRKFTFDRPEEKLSITPDDKNYKMYKEILDVFWRYDDQFFKDILNPLLNPK